jgi:hypothetical protein
MAATKTMSAESEAMMADLKILAVMALKILMLDSEVMSMVFEDLGDGSVAALMEPANPWIQRPSSPRSAPIDEVLTRQCPCLRAFDLGSMLGRLADSTASDRNRGCTRIYPGSAPRRVKTYILLV